MLNNGLKRVICFGAGYVCRLYLDYIGPDTEVLAIADNDPLKIGTSYHGHRVIAPDSIMKLNFDSIVITLDDRLDEVNEKTGLKRIESVYNQLLALGIEQARIELQYVEYHPNDPRIIFLRHFAQIINDNQTEGAVAECGVFKGSFSAYMNEYFPSRKMYLFDTFEGFKKDDMDAEDDSVTIEWLKSQDIGILETGSVFTTLLRCQHRENVVIKQGQVPQSLKGCEDEQFVFVNLDMDLYTPQLAALRFFGPRMVSGGLILLHDYYWKWTPGVKRAVDDYAKERNFTRVPIGDNSSIALVLQ